MRNGNYCSFTKDEKSFVVLILPMRNGNSWTTSDQAIGGACSYPTYEEWKQIFLESNRMNKRLCSYPTYEEWKPVLEI